MNKIDDAWVALKKLSPREQEIAADAILDYAAQDTALHLSDEQEDEVRRRLEDTQAATVTPAELRRRLMGS
jgi:hypothetical protein